MSIHVTSSPFYQMGFVTFDQVLFLLMQDQKNKTTEIQ